MANMPNSMLYSMSEEQQRKHHQMMRAHEISERIRLSSHYDLMDALGYQMQQKPITMSKAQAQAAGIEMKPEPAPKPAHMNIMLLLT